MCGVNNICCEQGRKYVKTFYLYFCFCYSVYTNHYLKALIFIFLSIFFLLCPSNCHIIRVVSISHNTGESNLPALVPVNIFLLCWIKIILLVGVLVEVKFANIFYGLGKYKHFKIPQHWCLCSAWRDLPDPVPEVFEVYSVGIYFWAKERAIFCRAMSLGWKHKYHTHVWILGYLKSPFCVLNFPEYEHIYINHILIIVELLYDH